MASLSHHYRDLGAPIDPTGPLTAEEDDALADMQLVSFDKGYQAGWEDALKAHERDAGTAAVGIAQNLQDMAFTHREAYLKLSSAMKPLLSLIVQQLLPPVAQKVLGAHLLEQLASLMDTHADAAIEIVVSPDNLADLQALLSDMARLPFTLTGDPQLGGGQAYLQVGNAEQEINLDAVLSGISEALEAFFDQSKEEMNDG